MPTESRAALKRRLQAEGRWDPYLERREALRKIHPLDEANRLAALEFEPLPPGVIESSPNAAPAKRAAASLPDPTTETTADDFKDKPPASARDNIMWVAENISRLDATPTQAPSGAAWNLLLAVRDPQSRMSEIFWGQMYTKMLPSQKELDEAGKFNNRNEQSFDLIQSAYDALLAAAAANAPRPVLSDGRLNPALFPQTPPPLTLRTGTDATLPFPTPTPTPAPAPAPSPGQKW